MMRRIIFKILLVAFVSVTMLSLGASSSVQAHELIPKAVLDYLQDNPNATPSEIEHFTESNAPAFYEKSRNGQDILKIARSQDSSFLNNAGDFVLLGIQHILSGPDHVLFVITLLLVYVSLRHSLKLITAFTLAHSVTLILAGLSILTLSSRIVEPIIALSISLMAITSVFYRNHSWFGNVQSKLGIVFFFGLFHGLGFAGLLREIQIPPEKFLASLVSFNIGVEIGQLLIIAVVLPIIYVCREKPWYPRAVQIIGLIIAVIGLFWALQRIILT